MRYVEIVPADPIRRLVRCYWFLSGPNAPRRASAEPALPDGSTELIFNLGDPFRACLEGRAPIRQPTAMLVGQITRPLTVGPTGRIDLVAVRFEPHGAALLFRPQARLTDRWIDARTIAGARLGTIRSSLREARGPAARAAVLDQVLSHLIATRPGPDPRVERAVRAIRSSHGTISMTRMTRDVATSPRNLQRLFAMEVGLSPKLLARITRFQRVFAAWQRNPRSLARVAAECGYFDQPHLIRDFQDFAGAAPAAFLASQPEFTAFFTTPRATS